MRFVTFHDDGRVRPGFIEENDIVAIDAPSLVHYIALAPQKRTQLHTSERVPLHGARLAAPVRPNKNVFCVGRNYLEHAKEGARAAGRELQLPAVPTFFSKAPTAIADPDTTLSFSRDVSQQYDWEGELAVVIGKRVKDAAPADALDAVFGYTCLNDITARDLQRAHLQWLKGKSLDDSCPLGPWIVAASAIADPQQLDITLDVNGIRKQESSTSNMIFPIARIICELSKGMTLEPGDVIATGTPEGVGFARTPPEFFADGDVVEIAIEKIGTLRNRIRLL